MPSREPELYKDKIEVSLDGRQIFYLFFGGSAIVGLVFVLGVMVGRRIEARGHLDRAETQAASDPLAALDRLERSDHLSFHDAITGGEAPTDVEKTIGEIEKRRIAGKPEGKAEKPEAKPEAKSETKPEVKAEKSEAKSETKPEAKADKLDARSEPVTRPEADKPRSDKHDGEKRSKKHDDGASGEARSDKAEARSEGDGKSSAKTDGKSNAKADGKSGEGKSKFTLQLSSFQDKGEAEVFLAAMKGSGYEPYLTEANVSGKGTFYRVRLGSYRSLDAANDAKADYERATRKTAQVMRL
jgi:DedD protein